MSYQSKALELGNSSIPSSYQPAHQGCAGIGRQLHPLKMISLMREKVIEIEYENEMRVYEYQSKTLELANSAISL